ncbi:hypothetical protein F2Q70_00008406 [Brassica cretica]|uniref:Uncharacterized protein n=1 Tax=Brassica cretica TaxID=69181 RepID=A0A8S9MA55_BRACR|nr:hypothetical protein F2Q70_00008406 [Brassica cretica]
MEGGSEVWKEARETPGAFVQNPTCPVCRTSPLPTPLAEVVSLASSVATIRMS